MATEPITLQFRADSRSTQRAIQQIETALGQLKGTSRTTSSRMQQDTRRVEQSQKRVSKTTRDLDRDQRRLGGTLRSAAKYAAGAATAYVGISQARAAVDATTDLAKSTLTLTKNLGFTTKTASELGAVLQARGADAKSIGMAFGTFSGKVEQAKAGSETAAKAFQQLGISQRELVRISPEKMLFRVADGMEALGEGTARTNAQRALFGRGWSTLGPIIRSGSDDLKAQLAIAEETRATFSKLGLKDMEDVIAAQRRMKLATLGLQIAFTQAIQPAIIGATDELTEFSKILSDPKLSAQEKLDAIGDRFAAFTVKLAEQATRQAPKVAIAFMRGFLDAPVWAQLATGGLLAARLGAISKLGAPIGRKFGLAFVGALLTLELGKQIKQIIEGEKLGQTSREAFSTELSDLGFDSKTFVGQNKVKVATDFGDLIFNAQTKTIIGAKGKQLKGLVGKTADEAFQAFSGTGPDAIKGVGKPFNQLKQTVRQSMRDISGVSKREMDRVEAALKKSPERGRAALAKAYDGMIDKIRRSMRDGRTSTKEGMDRIEQLTQAKLDLFGIPSIQAAASGGGGGTSGKGGKGGGGGSGGSFQSGGVQTVPGSGSGDKVPVRAMVEPGEALAVLNRNAAKAWMSWNAAFPRFAKGGAVEGKKGKSGGGKLQLPTYSATGGAAHVQGAAGLNLVARVAEKLVKRVAKDERDRGGGMTGKAVSGSTTAKAKLLAEKFGLSITSGFRTPEHNAAVGGAPNSSHMRGSPANPGAHDFMPASPAAMAFANAKWNPLWSDIHPPGPHLHISWFKKGGMVGLKKGGAVPAPKRGKAWIPLSTQGGAGDKHMSVDEGATLLWQAGLSQGQASQLARVLPGESGGQNIPNRAGSGASGYFQVMMPLHRGIVGKYGGNVWDYRTNVMSAVDIFRAQGFGAWEAARSGPAGKILRNAVEQTAGGTTAPGTTGSGAVQRAMEALTKAAGKGKKFKSDKAEIKFLTKKGFGKKVAQKAAAKWPVAAAGAGGDATTGTDAYQQALERYQELVGVVSEANRYYTADRALSMRINPIFSDFARQQGLSMVGPYSLPPTPPNYNIGPPPAASSPAMEVEIGMTKDAKKWITAKAKQKDKKGQTRQISQKLGRASRRYAYSPGRT